MSTLANFIQHSTGNPSCRNHPRKKKAIPIGKEEVKLSLFAGKTQILHQKVLELIHESSKVPGDKISVQRSIAFLYTDNEAAGRKLRNQSHLQLHQNP